MIKPRSPKIIVNAKDIPSRRLSTSKFEAKLIKAIKAEVMMKAMPILIKSFFLINKSFL